MAAPPIVERHLHHFHRRSPIKESVRVATTANITISTALNNGDSLDGITLATDDRVLVKNQSTASQNGIYVVAASPVRAYDQSTDDPAFGFLVYVREGTAGGGSLYRNTNTSAPTIGSTSITFAIVGSGGAASGVTVADAGGYFTGTNVETVLQELGALVDGVTAHGNTGTTETFLATTGVHTATLDNDCTFTFTALASGLASGMVLILTQDGTGSRTVTWPGSVVWPGGSAPTLSTAAGAVDVLTFISTDGGTTWFGFPTGGSSVSGGTPALTLSTTNSTGSASTAILTDATIAVFDATVPVTQAFGDSAATGSAGVAARRDHVHGMPATPSSSGGHTHVANETHLSDGSTTTYTLDGYYEPDSVIAWNTTTLARLTVTEVLPDQATVSAAGSSGDKIVFDYAATVA